MGIAVGPAFLELSLFEYGGVEYLGLSDQLKPGVFGLMPCLPHLFFSQKIL